jgi:hypothetical protein
MTLFARFIIPKELLKFKQTLQEIKAGMSY